ncbi:SIR2 family protein [Owenweeksia hongkongensis]|uniref:SIR2 family protein n=1 Tax=Owenweeksia hongkongensis TaxID=253245 RepID=UPI003A940A92
MQDSIVSVAHSIYSNKGAFALLLGSGISRSSGIPTGWEITLELVRRIALFNGIHTLDNPEQWYLAKFNESLDYSNIIEKLTKTPEERINLLRPFIEPTQEEAEEGLKTPQLAHQKIAELVKAGFVKVIITTNFDRLLENALKQAGVEPTVISNPSHVDNCLPLIHSNVTVIKINGDYLDTKLLNIKSELNNYDDDIANLVGRVFEEFGLVSCGWSAKWDLALVDILKSSNKFRFSSFFTYISNPTKEIEDLSTYRRGQVIQIKDADMFFKELAENVKALSEGNTVSPLTHKVALARVKKYVTREEYLVTLYDLMQDIVEVSLENVNSIDLKTTPTWESANEVLELYVKKVQLIAEVMAEGISWSKEYNNATWLTPLNQFCNNVNPMQKSRYALWSGMSRVPLLILRYIVGISCLRAKNYALLARHFDLEVDSGWNTEGILHYSQPFRMIDYNQLREVLGNKNHTPMSVFLHDKIRPFYKRLIPVDKDFDLIFDEYEILASTVYISKKGSASWGMMGRYGYRDRDHKLLDNMISYSKDKENEINSKCFTSDPNDGFEKYANVLKEFLSDIHFH